jgi:uncharacterized protein YndB with AHSA1/START domain
MSDLDDGDDEKEVRLEIQIAASPETVFALLTEPAQLKTWFADLVDADCRPGGVFRVTGPRGGSIEGTYLEIVPNRKVVFTWGGLQGLAPGASTVEFRIEPHGAGTLLRLRHYGLPKSRIEPHRDGWTIFGLPKLKDAAEGRPPAITCVSAIAQARNRQAVGTIPQPGGRRDGLA